MRANNTTMSFFRKVTPLVHYGRLIVIHWYPFMQGFCPLFRVQSPLYGVNLYFWLHVHLYNYKMSATWRYSICYWESPLKRRFHCSLKMLTVIDPTKNATRPYEILQFSKSFPENKRSYYIAYEQFLIGWILIKVTRECWVRPWSHWLFQSLQLLWSILSHR